MSTLTDDEIARIKTELGDNVLDSAEPYFGDTQSLYALIRDNVSSASTAATSSSTAVSQATVDAGGATTITVASASGLSAGTRVQLDVDGARETVTIRNVSSTTLSLICRKPHSGTYPVEIESALTLVRGTLSDLVAIEQGNVPDSLAQAGLRKVDEVEFSDKGVAESLEKARYLLRRRLATQLGLGALMASNPSVCEVY